jgi:archaellum component FlaG (FlaF/FlaG flagellin family)
LEERTGHVIQIQSVKFEETKTKIYVQNTGKGAVILDLAIVDGETVEISKQNCLVSSYETTTVNETQTAEITINQNYGKKIRIKVVCVDGISYESDWSP